MYSSNRETGEFTTSGGVVLKCRPVSTQVLIKMKQTGEFPKPPEPPVQQTSLGPVKNENHPDYLAATEKYNLDMGTRYQNLQVELGVSTAGLEIDKAGVAEIKDSMASMGMPLEKLSDKVIYLAYLLILDEQEWSALVNFIESLGKPTVQEVAAHRESFQSDIPPEA